ncbi:MAG: DUF1761 domain-containing protein [bacterium]|nr:DUF1761 domain-containing protein [bacterium]
MLYTINTWAVLVAAVVAYLAGWAWYSPILWQKPWMESLGKTDADWGEKAKKDMPRTIAYGFLTTLAISFSMAVFMEIANVDSFLNALQIGMLVCFGFLVTTKFSDMIYEYPAPNWGKLAQQLFLIEAGYQIVLFGILSSVIWWVTNM